MKTLHYRRHSTKGTDNNLTDEGIVRAILEGLKAGEQRIPGSGNDIDGPHRLIYDRLFHGPLIRTAQTALVFCHGLNYIPKPMPVIPEIGTDELFMEIATPEFREAAKKGASNFDATLNVHDVSWCQEWAVQAKEAIRAMFKFMRNGEYAVAFGHSPVIELAAWACWSQNFSQLPDRFRRIGDMEGIEFIQQDDGMISVGEKIVVG